MAEPEMTLDQVRQWFAERGFNLDLHPDAGQWWADLVGRETHKVIAPRYGRGDSELNAARRAKERYEAEQ